MVVVKDASLTQTYSFLPASWVGDTHEETDFLPIGDREAKECLNRRSVDDTSTYGKVLSKRQSRSRSKETRLLATSNGELA